MKIFFQIPHFNNNTSHLFHSPFCLKLIILIATLCTPSDIRLCIYSMKCSWENVTASESPFVVFQALRKTITFLNDTKCKSINTALTIHSYSFQFYIIWITLFTMFVYLYLSWFLFDDLYPTIATILTINWKIIIMAWHQK